MNVRCQLFLWVTVIIFLLLSSCVKEDEDKCSGLRGVDIRFYSSTVCQADTVYPQQIGDLLYGVFDEKEILVSYEQLSNVELSAGYSRHVTLTSGLYTVVAWSGIDPEYYTVSGWQIGVTWKSDFLLRVIREGSGVTLPADISLFYGESPALYIPESKGPETYYAWAAVNMMEITNRLTVSVEGLSDPEAFEVFIEVDNGSMNVNGSMAADEVIEYQATESVTGSVLTASVVLLKLETGITNTLVIRSRTTGTEVFRGNLLGTLLLKNPEVNLACDHDFTIRFTAEDQCECGTYIMTEIWVNNWLVHSYDFEM
ncbi:MAG: FimB/Mfa2 family fimbrial subunit [Bacteroides sp.]|nr:FimB/Mfa2 family fimbrial subunit [Bacteroides sp.]